MNSNFVDMCEGIVGAACYLFGGICIKASSFAEDTPTKVILRALGVASAIGSSVHVANTMFVDDDKN